MTLNPLEAVETMTAFIAQVGIGDVPDRQHRVQDDLRGRRDAVRGHVLMNMISIRLVRKYREVYE